MKKSYIWTLPTRIFHWMLVFYIAVMFLTSEEESWLTWHAAFGYAIGILLLFRVLWGFMGPIYSRFSDFPLSKEALISFILTIRYPKRVYAGHNPAASWVMMGILTTLIFISISGLLTYGVQEGRGLFSFLNTLWFKEMELFAEIHEFFFYFLVLLVTMHLGGILSDKLLHPKIGTLHSIFNGYKYLDAKESKLTSIQKYVAVFFLILALITPFYVLISDDSILYKSTYTSIDYKNENPLFVEECASCHLLYPPFLLPKKSWKKMMTSLSDHFGDDASLDEVDRRDIEAYLLKNSAETSTKEAAFYILKSIPPKKDIISISQTPYWKKRHKEINKTLFESKEVRTKANCKACHQGFEQGLIEDDKIVLPKKGI